MVLLIFSILFNCIILDSDEEYDYNPVLKRKNTSNSLLKESSNNDSNIINRKINTNSFRINDHLIKSYFTKESLKEKLENNIINFNKSKYIENNILTKISNKIVVINNNIKRSITLETSKNKRSICELKKTKFNISKLSNSIDLNLDKNILDIFELNLLDNYNADIAIKTHKNSNYITKINNNLDFQIKLGSLCTMYLSDYFNIDMLLYDLEDKKEFNTICCFLINLLYNKRFFKNILDYIPFLFNMILYHKSKYYIKNFLLDMCVDRIRFSIKLYWTSVAYCEENNDEDMDTFLIKIEETLIKNRRATKKVHYSEFNYNSNFNSKSNCMKELNNNKLNINFEKSFIKNKICKKFSINILLILFKDEETAINQQLLNDYFHFVTEFYDKIKDLCESLKYYDKEESSDRSRASYLKSNLNTYNQMLVNKRIEVINEYFG